ncbi:MAG: hypothetical protein D6760_13055 [Deltaproteobacteria bacterium]|nr:MAG: hypothetical protein D6760_13055 [Deltaproteobacteria bacterium]
MSMIKTIWGFLFRLFPCPTALGLRRIGNPGRDSPVLVTCNFDLTVKRMRKALRGIDAWLLVAESKGVNVWCAAGAREFNTDSVVSAVKTSGIESLVDHRTLILPPLGAPGIRAADVAERTGWKTVWGPVRLEDIPRFLSARLVRSEDMKRATWNWKERLDTALGSLFPFYFAGALLLAFLGRSLLLEYLVVGAVVFVFFMLACPWIPTQHGLTKALVVCAVLGGGLAAARAVSAPLPAWLPSAVWIAMVLVVIYGTELGGLASTLASDLDPFLARLGIGAVGNVALAGTVRTELLNGYRLLTHTRERCDRCHGCIEVCPQRVWEVGRDDERSVFAHPEWCTACTACLMQCRSGAIQAHRVRAQAGARAPALRTG